MKITSKDNEAFKSVKALLTKKYRDEMGLYLLEGKKFVKDASESGICAECIVLTDANLQDELYTHKTLVVDETLMKLLSDTKTPQGVIGVYRKKNPDLKDFEGMERILCLDGVQNSDNVGALIRSSVCSGYGGTVLLKGCADCYSPKAVRASAGSIIRANVTYSDAAFLMRLKDNGFTIVGAHLEGKETAGYNNKKQVLVIGSEGGGITNEVCALCDELVRIPIYGRCESLNAAVAGGILMYKSIGY